MIKKTLMTAAAACLLTVGAYAKSVVFTLSDGQLVYYLLQTGDFPMLRFTDDGFTVNTDSYDFSGVKNFYISATDDPNAIGDVEADGKSAISMTDDCITVSGAKKAVAIYTVDGVAVNAESTADGATVKVDISALPAGVYVVKCGEASFKIRKK